MNAKRIGVVMVGLVLIVHSICVLAITHSNTVGHGPSDYIPGISIGGVRVVSADWPVWPSYIMLLAGVAVVYRASRGRR